MKTKYLAIILLYIGCGPSMENACHTLVQARCEWIFACEDSPIYANLESCIDVGQQQCVTTMNLPGVEVQPEELETCADKIEPICGQKYECTLSNGTLAAGISCEIGWQCQSGKCIHNTCE